MNAAFGPDAIDAIESDGDTVRAFHPDSPPRLSEALRTVPNAGISGAVAEFIDSWPSGIQAAIQAVIHHNLTRETRVPVTVAWSPGYDFSVQIFDVTDTATSRGGITILLTSRYPADTHPLSGVSGASGA